VCNCEKKVSRYLCDTVVTDGRRCLLGWSCLHTSLSVFPSTERL